MVHQKCLQKLKQNGLSYLLATIFFCVLDSETAYTKVLEDLAKKYGKELTHDICVKVMGSVYVDTINILIDEWKLTIPFDQVFKDYQKMEEEKLSKTPLMPGMNKLIRHLYSHGIPIAIATSSSEQMALMKTAHLPQIYELFHHVVRNIKLCRVINIYYLLSRRCAEVQMQKLKKGNQLQIYSLYAHQDSKIIQILKKYII